MSAEDFLRIGRKITVLPVIHGSGDFSLRVREELLERPYDCVAVPLPTSFQPDVEAAVLRLPAISAVIQRDAGPLEAEDDEPRFSYVPIDPSQPVIAAIRFALEEHIPRAFIDAETKRFESTSASFPDPYALKRVSPAAFAASVLPAIPRPATDQHRDRIAFMAGRLRELEREHDAILLVCSLLDWPWIKDAYDLRTPAEEPTAHYAPIQTCPVDPRTLLFFLGELPFIAGLYERARSELGDDSNLSIDGVKELVLEARDRLRARKPNLARRLTPQLLSIYLRYVRNLALIDRRLAPGFADLIDAARQTGGDDFALSLAETAREYPYEHDPDSDDGGAGEEPELRMSIGRGDVPLWGEGEMASRLPGPLVLWRKIELRPRPDRAKKQEWRRRWNPFGQCSWPPEDERIESFHRHVRDQAKALIGADLARSEKFTTSLRDGLDLRETLRNWHKGDLYVKVVPPARGSVEVVIFLFDVPADPDRYPYRVTWYAEHVEESTLAFFGTDPMADLVGPGIARSEYGGALFLFPPRHIPDIWTDPRLRFARSLESRLVAAGLMHSRERHVAIVSPCPPKAEWRQIARRFGKRILHLPLKRFGASTIERLRVFHTLNGKQVRTYAADFIQDA